MTGAILVGGRSRRLKGGDKTALRRDGERVIQRLAEVLTGVCDEVALVGREEQEEPMRALGVGAFYADLYPGCGPLGGLYTALEETEDDVFLLACDLPYVEDSLLRRLRDEFAPRQGRIFAVVPRTLDPKDEKGARLEPLCAVWSRLCRRPAYLALEAEEYSVSNFAREVNAFFLDLTHSEHEQLRNINTPGDLEGQGGALTLEG